MKSTGIEAGTYFEGNTRGPALIQTLVWPSSAATTQTWFGVTDWNKSSLSHIARSRTAWWPRDPDVKGAMRASPPVRNLVARHGDWNGFYNNQRLHQAPGMKTWLRHCASRVMVSRFGWVITDGFHGQLHKSGTASVLGDLVRYRWLCCVDSCIGRFHGFLLRHIDECSGWRQRK